MKRDGVLIVFEGVDKSGKTTIIREFNKATNFSYVVLDRFTISGKTYSNVFNRGDFLYQDNVEKSIVKSLPTLCVLCVSDPLVIRCRLTDAKEVLPPEVDNIARTQLLFKAYYNNSNFEHKLFLDTSMLTIDECVKLVKNAVKEMEESERAKKNAKDDAGKTLKSADGGY